MRYNTTPCEHDGYKFPTTHEGDVYLALKLEQRAGEISKLQCHPKFVYVVNDQEICKYTPDFTYLDKSGAVHVIDAKGFKKSKKTGKLLPRVDREFGIKKKLMLACFGLEIEIR